MNTEFSDRAKGMRSPGGRDRIVVGKFALLRNQIRNVMYRDNCVKYDNNNEDP
jgi:hypothetical protein